MDKYSEGVTFNNKLIACIYNITMSRPDFFIAKKKLHFTIKKGFNFLEIGEVIKVNLTSILRAMLDTDEEFYYYLKVVDKNKESPRRTMIYTDIVKVVTGDGKQVGDYK